MDEKERRWLWFGWIPLGCLSFIDGPPGAQTATVAAWLATTVLRGGPLPDGARIGQDSTRQVMWVGDDRARSLFRTLGAPLDRVFGPYDPDNRGAAVDLANDRWLAIVTELVQAELPCWVIVDGIGISRGNLGAVDRALTVMARIARDTGCAVTLLCDQDEAIGPSAEARAAFAERMATVMVLDRWGSTTADMRFRVIESKLGGIPDSLRLRLETGIPEVVHEPPAPPESAVDRAVAFLERELADGPQPASQLIDLARSDRISKRSLERAKRLLELRVYQSCGRWLWSLPA